MQSKNRPTRNGMVSSSRNLIQLTFKMLCTPYAQHETFFRHIIMCVCVRPNSNKAKKNSIRQTINRLIGMNNEHVPLTESINCAIFTKESIHFPVRKNSKRMAHAEISANYLQFEKPIHIFALSSLFIGCGRMFDFILNSLSVFLGISGVVVVFVGSLARWLVIQLKKHFQN